MEELLLINPSPRKGKRKMATRKRRTPAQRRATAKMLAANRARRRRRNPRATYAANPAPRRRRRSAARAIRRVTRRYRRNPGARMGNLPNLLMGSFQGAVGAIAVNMAYNFIPLPVALKTGNMQYVAKGALAVGLGMMVRNRMVAEMVKGSLTVTMYDALKNLTGTMLPGMAGLGYYPGGMVAGGYPRVNAAPSPALSEYVNSPGMAGMQSIDEYVSDY